jgi:hypothetical protein
MAISSSHPGHLHPRVCAFRDRLPPRIAAVLTAFVIYFLVFVVPKLPEIRLAAERHRFPQIVQRKRSVLRAVAYGAGNPEAHAMSRRPAAVTRPDRRSPIPNFPFCTSARSPRDVTPNLSQAFSKRARSYRPIQVQESPYAHVLPRRLAIPCRLLVAKCRFRVLQKIPGWISASSSGVILQSTNA